MRKTNASDEVTVTFLKRLQIVTVTSSLSKVLQFPISVSILTALKLIANGIIERWRQQNEYQQTGTEELVADERSRPRSDYRGLGKDGEAKSLWTGEQGRGIICRAWFWSLRGWRRCRDRQTEHWSRTWGRACRLRNVGGKRPCRPKNRGGSTAGCRAASHGRHS